VVVVVLLQFVVGGNCSLCGGGVGKSENLSFVKKKIKINCRLIFMIINTNYLVYFISAFIFLNEKSMV
jgi:hypothetical protein